MRLLKVFRRLVDRIFRRYYEGPPPPRRLSEELRIWVALNPGLPNAVLVGYCQLLIDSAYRDGFIRGLEWRERGWASLDGSLDQLAEIARQNASIADTNPRAAAILDTGTDPADPLRNVPDPERARFFAYLRLAPSELSILSEDQLDDRPTES